MGGDNMNKLKSYLMKGGLALGAFLGVVQANAAKAAADADLTAGLASTTAIFTDNKSVIITWIVGIFAVTIVVALVIRALGFGKRAAVGMIPGGRKGRR